MATQPSTEKMLPSRGRYTRKRAQRILEIVILGTLIMMLLNYKGVAGLSKIQETHTSGSVHLGGLPGVSRVSDSETQDSIQYFRIILPALLFGILISAAVRTSLSHTSLPSFIGRATARGQLAAAATGAPLMLCSCCVAPIFPTIYEKTRKMAPALALALASPSLNPIALTLSFLLFPLPIAGGRVLMALILVLIGSWCVAGLTQSHSGAEPKRKEVVREESWRNFFAAYGRSLLYITVRTVPLIVIGVWISMLVMRHFPIAGGGTSTSHIVGVLTVALGAVLITMPSLFEIPLALSLLAAGAPSGAALAILFAGPAINLPSLLVIGRNSSWRTAFALGLAVWIIASVGGLLIR